MAKKKKTQKKQKTAVTAFMDPSNLNSHKACGPQAADTKA